MHNQNLSKYLTFIILITALGTICFLFRKPSNRPAPAPGPPPFPKPVPPPAPEYPDVSMQLLTAHNFYRARAGLPPYKMNKQLYKAAQEHADYMAKRGRLAHFGIGDGTPWSRIKEQNYNYSYAGENVAWNQRDPQEATDAWMSDWGHRVNVLSKQSTECGLAGARGPKGDWYWAADYATPASENNSRQTIDDPVKFTPVDESLPLWPCPVPSSGMLTPAVDSDHPTGLFEVE